MPSPHPKLSPKGPSGRGERLPYRTLTQGAQRAELALPLALVPVPPPTPTPPLTEPPFPLTAASVCGRLSQGYWGQLGLPRMKADWRSLPWPGD